MKYTPEDLARIQNEIDANIEAQRQLMSERAYNDNVISLAHVKACTAAGIDPKLGPEDTKEAKLYSRGRAFALQHKAWNFVENQLDDPNAKPSMKAWAADLVFARSVGPIDTPNEIKADLNATTPLEAIERIMTELTAGNITPKYADFLVKTQAGQFKVSSLKTLLRRICAPLTRNRTLSHHKRHPRKIDYTGATGAFERGRCNQLFGCSIAH